MAVVVTDLPGGSREEWDLDAYRRYAPDGLLLVDRPLTFDEAADVAAKLAARELAASRDVTTVTLKDQARNALATNDTFLDLPTPSFPLTVAAQTALVNQVRALTRQNAALIRLVLAGDLLDAVQP